MLGNLANEAIFKKAFTDKFVLRCFVKDLFDVDFEPETVETERRFEPKMSYIDFKYDIFAQNKDKRVVVEIQRVDYDYNFDRFLLYHNMAIAEMQRNSEEYKTDRVVFTIVVFTGKYISKERNGKLVQSDILLHNSNLFDIEGKEYDTFGHKLIFLNHNYLKATTLQRYGDWLRLVRESIKNPKDPILNLSNQGIRKVTELIDYEQLNAEERRLSKNRNAAESATIAYEAHYKLEGKIEGKIETQIETAKNSIKAGLTNEIIAQITGLTHESIQALRTAINTNNE
jgi:predicted transposase/invertase (TIGR01784 family)